jgi:hypothetical protein
MKSEKHFSIKDGKVISDTHFVCVLPYLTDDNGVIVSIGTDENGNTLKSAIDKEDSSIVSSAKNLLTALEFSEENLSDSTRWKFLGSVILTSDVPVKHFLWAFNMRSVENEKVKMSNIAIALDTVNDTKESLLMSSFFMLFMQIYKKEFQDGRNA